ncbi:MAG: hypothetical protein H7Z13_04615 [Ferruginibacter sp.]|nr:hypothetical protein [Ferruginibacter sp.]
MISILVCSVNPALLAKLRLNVGATVKTPFEILAFDNRKEKKGLARVYNQLAAEARFDILCFVHEDVIIHTTGWGESLEKLLANKEIGLVGISGAVYKSKYPAPWSACDQSLYRTHSIQHFSGRPQPVTININPASTQWAEVAVIDGVLMATRKSVLKEYAFDEKLLTGFHGYDMDYCLQVGQRYKLVVTYELLLEHLSSGNFNENWITASFKIHRKWRHALPKNIFNKNERLRLPDYTACASVLNQLLAIKGHEFTVIKYYVLLVFLFFKENKLRYTKTVLRYFFGIKDLTGFLNL